MSGNIDHSALIGRLRFSVRTLLVMVVMIAICVVILERISRGARERWHIEAELRGMGAYYVAFNEGDNKPDWVSFAGTLKSLQVARFRSFKQIDFTDVRMTDESARNIAALEYIEILHLTNCDVSDAQIDLLAGTGRVEILRLNGSPITDDAIPAIASIAGLKSVDLSGTLVTDKGVANMRTLCPHVVVVH